MPIRKTFNYNSNSKNGLFYELRQKSIPYDIESPDFHVSTNYCTIDHYGLKAIAIADGKLERLTAWRSNLENTSYFIIDFYYMDFLITGYTIVKDCNTVPPLIILGSNDNITWKEIDKQPEMGTTQSFAYFPIRKHENSFRFIKFSNIKFNGKKIHISELELFGTLNHRLTCKKHFFFNPFPSFAMILLLFS